MTRLGRAALLVLAAALSAASADGVVVVDDAGDPVPSAHLMCIDPVGEFVRADARGRAFLEQACRWARCDATGYLSGEVDLSRAAAVCRLRAGVVVEGSVSGADCSDGCEARLVRSATGAAVAAAAVAPEPPSRFRFPAVEPARYRIEIERLSDGWTCAAQLAPLVRGLSVVVADWADPSVLSGRVVDGEGAEIEGARIVARTLSESVESSEAVFGRWRCRGPVAPAATSGVEGRFELADLPSGPLLLLAESGELRAARAVGARARAGEPPPQPTLVATVPPVVFGRVVDEEGEAVSCRAALTGLGEAERLAGSSWGAEVETRCDEDGAFEVGPLPPGESWLVVVPDGGRLLRRRVDTRGGDVDVGEIVRERGAEARFLVLDPSGDAVAGAELRVRVSDGLVTERTATTDAQGRALLSGIPERATLEIDARAEGFVPAHRRLGRVPEDEVELMLDPGASLEGEVLTTGGDPLPNAHVRARAEGRLLDEATTGEAGRFRLGGLPPGGVRITAERIGYVQREELELALEAGESAAFETLLLEPLDRIRGAVVDPAGRFVAGARVSIASRWDLADIDDLRPVAQALTGDEGTFELPRLEGADLVLLAMRRGFGARVRELPGPGAAARLTLPLAARLVVELPADTSAGDEVLVVDGAGVGRRVRTTGSLELALTDLAPGGARAGFIPGPEQSVRLFAGQERRVRVARGATVSGRVLEGGLPAAGAIVLLAELAGDGALWGPHTTSDETGAFRFEGLESGERLLVAEGRGTRAEQRVVVPDSGRVEAELELRRVALDVSVVDADSLEPLSGVALRLRPEWAVGQPIGGRGFTFLPRSEFEPGFEMMVTDCGCATGRTDAAGFATLRVGEPGPYLLELTAQSYRPNERWIDLAQGVAAATVPLERRSLRLVRISLTTDPPGSPVELLCRSGGRPVAWEYVADQGRCEDVPSGALEVFARVIGHGTARAVIDVPESGEVETEIRVDRGGVLLVPVSDPGVAHPRVHDLDGIEWVELLRQIDPPGNYQPRRSVDPELGDVWIVPDLPAGAYTVTVEGRTRESVAVLPGERVVAR